MTTLKTFNLSRYDDIDLPPVEDDHTEPCVLLGDVGALQLRVSYLCLLLSAIRAQLIRVL